MLLTIVFFSYRQTIAAYPNGGGSYTVASENLGEKAGLLAAAALMIDYILTAAVGISAGVTALTSAVPSLQPHTLALVPGDSGDAGDGEHARRAGYGRGVHAADVSVCGDAAGGDWRGGVQGGDAAEAIRCRWWLPPTLPPTVTYLSLWMLMKVFSSGCAAMTGVEAVSNGVMAFGEPTSEERAVGR